MTLVDFTKGILNTQGVNDSVFATDETLTKAITVLASTQAEQMNIIVDVLERIQEQLGEITGIPLARGERIN